MLTSIFPNDLVSLIIFTTLNALANTTILCKELDMKKEIIIDMSDAKTHKQSKVLKSIAVTYLKPSPMNFMISSILYIKVKI